jgi:hypothetical protein
MKALTWFFTGLYIIGYGGNTLLLLYVEWALVMNNWWELLNPFFQLKVLYYMVTQPLFWILVGITVLGMFASIGAKSVEKDVNK